MWYMYMQDRGAWWATVHRVTESDTTEATKHARINTTDYSSVMEKTETLPWATTCTDVGTLCQVKQVRQRKMK